jgi:hypothetical protein
LQNVHTGKKEKGKKGTKDKDDGKKKKIDEDEDPGFKMGTSCFLTDLMVAGSEYDEVSGNKNDFLNYSDLSGKSYIPTKCLQGPYKVPTRSLEMPTRCP